MTGTAANAGTVRFRFLSTTTTEIFTDRVLCEYTALPESSGVLHSGVAQSATSNTIVLDTGANATDDFYKHGRVVIRSGTGSEQERIIVEYTGSSKTAKIAPPWITNPDSTSAFEILPGTVHAETGWPTTKVGLAAAATSTTITLDSDASSERVHIDAGTGEGQSRIITDYVGSTKVATVSHAWTTTPDTTSEYIISDAVASVDYIASEALAQINTEVDTALTDYDAATGTELAAVDTKIDTIDTNVDSILVDTAEIGTAGAGLTDLGGMSTAMKAEVNAEVVDVLVTDTHAEVGQETPAATQSFLKMIQYLYKAWRNKTEVTATAYKLYDDAGTTVDQKSTLSDDSTTFTDTEKESGP
jgi:hypothetical protein